MKQVISNAFVEHFDNEIELVSSEGLDGKESRQHHASEDYFVFPRLCRLMVECTIRVAQRNWLSSLLDVAFLHVAGVGTA